MVKLIRLRHLFISGCLFFAVLNNPALSDPLPLWEQKHVQLQQQRDVVFAQLEELHTTLLVRAEIEDPSLLNRLLPEPPEARASGYGLLPLLKENDPQVTIGPAQTLYSLQWLEGRLHAEQHNAGKMLEQVSDSTALEDLLTRYEESIKRLRNLEDNLSYHAKWQKAVVKYPAYYQKKNELVDQARELSSLIDNDASALMVAELRNRLLQRAAPFRPTRNLQVTVTATGEMVLPVTICTDIEDSNFLSAFKGGVEEAFSLSPAARENQFSVELNWQKVSAESLYPDGVPARGAHIDMKAHHARFTACPLVLTTGASSLNAGVGSRIFLGTKPVSPRTLAHEFGHLLGFEDAYLRGYDGDPSDPFGVTLVEWTGLSSDLMGDSRRGQVSDEMIRKLISVYGGTLVP